MTDIPEQVQLWRQSEAVWKKHLAALEDLRAAFAEMERRQPSGTGLGASEATKDGDRS